MISQFTQGIAGIVGCCIAAFVLEESHPKWAFLIYSIYAFILFIACFFLNPEAERCDWQDELDITEISSEYRNG
jgi:predicted MFS family arabinose efflux permease